MGVTRTQAELLVLAVLLVVAWRVARPGDRATAPHAAGASASSATTGASHGEGLAARTRTLHTRLAPQPPRGPTARNPFRFRQSGASSATAGAGMAAAAQAARAAGPPVPARPEMALEGIAEDAGNGHPDRTAVISVLGQLVFAHEGDRVLSRFLVVRIAADAVQLRDEQRGELFSLALK